MTLRLLLLLCLAVRLPAPPPVAGGPYDVRFVELRRDVVVAVRPDVLRDPVAGNVTILINDRDVILVDAGAAPTSAEQILAEIRRRTDLPVSTIVLTHGHEDHVLGTQVFAEAYPALRVIARQGTRDYLAAEGPVARRVGSFVERVEGSRARGRAEVERLVAEGAAAALIENLERRWGTDLDAAADETARVRVHQPDEVFFDRYVIERGARSIELLDLGVGKSGSDTVVYLPHERIVIAGDTVVHPFPYGFARDPEGWIGTIEALLTLEFDLLIPGHGEVLRSKEYLHRVIALERAVLAGAREGLRAGHDADRVYDALDWAPWVEEFAGGDPVREYYLDAWMLRPAVARAVTALQPVERPGGEGSIR